MQTANAQLAWGGEVDGGPALWVGHSSGLHALRVKDGKVTTWAAVQDRPVAGLHIDKKGTVWALSQGELLRRDGPGVWTTLLLDDPPTAMYRTQGQGAMWLAGKALWRLDAGVLHRVDAAPKAKQWQCDPQGRLLARTADGLLRVQTTPPSDKLKIGWKNHIKPIFDMSCSGCHSEDGVVTKLHTPKLWQSYYALIVDKTSTGAMPLAPTQPLTPAQKATILGWGSDGFQE